MIVIQGFLRTEPENVAGLKQAALPLIAASCQETGNIAYAFAEDIAEPGLVHFIERWADEAALAAHNSTPHLAAFLGALPSLGIIAFRTARYDAAGETLLAGA